MKFYNNENENLFKYKKLSKIFIQELLNKLLNEIREYIYITFDNEDNKENLMKIEKIEKGKKNDKILEEFNENLIKIKKIKRIKNFLDKL